jgi:hypothetical protein
MARWLKYAVAFHPYIQSQRLKEAADKCISTGEEYRETLQNLLDYELTTGASEVDEQEIQRIRKMIGLLDLEMERIRSIKQ